MARGDPRHIYYGPGEWELLCDLLLGSHEFDVRSWGDESVLDGYHCCTCPGGESSTERRVDSADFGDFIDSVGAVDLGAVTRLNRLGPNGGRHYHETSEKSKYSHRTCFGGDSHGHLGREPC